MNFTPMYMDSMYISIGVAADAPRSFCWPMIDVRLIDNSSGHYQFPASRIEPNRYVEGYLQINNNIERK